MKTKIKQDIIILLLIGIIFNGCSSSREITSKWITEEVKVDGDVSDWQGKLLNIEDKNFSIGFQNDNNFLYLCLIVDDPFKAMQMLRAGFIIWFMPEKNSEVFGIKYPIGISVVNLERGESFNWENETPNRSRKPELEKMAGRLIDQELNFQIVNKDKYPLWQYPLNNQKGIKPKLSINSNKLIYELQVPIAKESENDFEESSKSPLDIPLEKIFVAPGKNLDVVLETEEIEVKNFDSERGRVFSNIPDMGSQRPAGGMRGMRGFSRPEPLNYKFVVVLEKK